MSFSTATQPKQIFLSSPSSLIYIDLIYVISFLSLLNCFSSLFSYLSLPLPPLLLPHPFPPRPRCSCLRREDRLLSVANQILREWQGKVFIGAKLARLAALASLGNGWPTLPPPTPSPLSPNTPPSPRRRFF